MPFRPQPFAIAIVLAFASVAHAQDQQLPDSQAFLARSLKNLRSDDLVRSQYTHTRRRNPGLRDARVFGNRTSA